jgi:hypothetical protein
MISPRNIALTIFIVLTPVLAHADQAAATACSARLSDGGKLVYEKVAPSVAPQTDLKEAITAVLRPLVMNGSMKREQARTAAEEAGECLKLLR